MIDGTTFFNHPVENYIGTNKNNENIKIDQEGNYAKDCLLHYS